MNQTVIRHWKKVTRTMDRSPEDAACRKCYDDWARSCRHHGLDEEKLSESRDDLSEKIWFVRKRAYRPTGVALGCPLPEPDIQKLFCRIATDIARRVQQLYPGDEPAMSYVPREWYHTTLVNYSHYGEDEPEAADNANGQARETSAQRPWRMPKVLLPKVIDIIRGCGFGEVTVRLRGLFLTRQGTVLVRGYPTDDRVYELRQRLLDAEEDFGHHITKTVHFKLGHLIAPIGSAESEAALAIVDRHGAEIDARLTFRKAYTPVGGVDL